MVLCVWLRSIRICHISLCCYCGVSCRVNIQWSLVNTEIVSLLFHVGIAVDTLHKSAPAPSLAISCLVLPTSDHPIFRQRRTDYRLQHPAILSVPVLLLLLPLSIFLSLSVSLSLSPSPSPSHTLFAFVNRPTRFLSYPLPHSGAQHYFTLPCLHLSLCSPGATVYGYPLGTPPNTTQQLSALSTSPRLLDPFSASAFSLVSHHKQSVVLHDSKTCQRSRISTVPLNWGGRIKSFENMALPTLMVLWRPSLPSHPHRKTSPSILFLRATLPLV